MKQLIVLIVAVAVSGMFPSHSAEAGGRKTAITGTVVDTYCLITMDMGGKSHTSCATTCVKSGAPLAIKEDKTGTVYLTAGHEKNMTFASSGLEQYVEQHVTVRGTLYERDGLKMIVVDSAAPAK
jgi:hypothetical protein